MSPVSAPADKRFRRAHVKPARRRRWRTMMLPLVKYAIASTAIVAGLYTGGSAVVHARALQIDRLAIRGNSQLSAAAVYELLDGIKGESILWTDLDAWRQRLRDSPWVKDAGLRRVLPSTIEVVVQERQPLALARIKGQLYLVDEVGGIIDEFGPAYASFDLPILDGLSAPNGSADASRDPERAQLAARVIAALRSDPELADRLSQIDVRDPRNAGVILKGDTAVMFVGRDRILQRVQSYLQVSDRIRQSVPTIDAVDLRLESQIVVQPSGRTKAAQAQKR